MSRGFDGFEIDDFRDSGLDSGRHVGRTSSATWNATRTLDQIHRVEERADTLDREERQRSRGERPPLAREERVQAILSQRARTKYTDRDKDYSLRDSEIHTLSEIGKFRIVAANDLAEFAYNGDHIRMENDVESLSRQGLAKATSIADSEHNPIQVVTLTKEAHKFLSRGKTRLLAFDFILANPEDHYFETAEEKRRYVIERFKLDDSLFSRRNLHGKAITFAEGFPLCVAYPAPDFMPVVTFTYVDPEHRNVHRYIAHLRTYRPLFRQLPSFQFVYISTAAGLQKEAAELFSFLVEGKGLSDLARYFDVQTKWDSRKYSLVTEDDMLFRHEATKRFKGEVFDTLFYLWRRNQLPKEFRPEAAATTINQQKILFQAVTVPGHEGVFGDSRKRWGDGSQVRGTPGAARVQASPARQSQTLRGTADA